MKLMWVGLGILDIKAKMRYQLGALWVSMYVHNRNCYVTMWPLWLLSSSMVQSFNIVDHTLFVRPSTYGNCACHGCSFNAGQAEITLMKMAMTLSVFTELDKAPLQPDNTCNGFHRLCRTNHDNYTVLYLLYQGSCLLKSWLAFKTDSLLSLSNCNCFTYNLSTHI